MSNPSTTKKERKYMKKRRRVYVKRKRNKSKESFPKSSPRFSLPKPSPRFSLIFCLKLLSNVKLAKKDYGFTNTHPIGVVVQLYDEETLVEISFQNSVGGVKKILNRK